MPPARGAARSLSAQSRGGGKNSSFSSALAGNRTRASRVAGENSTTEPPMPDVGLPPSAAPRPHIWSRPHRRAVWGEADPHPSAHTIPSAVGQPYLPVPTVLHAQGIQKLAQLLRVPTGRVLLRQHLEDVQHRLGAGVEPQVAQRRLRHLPITLWDKGWWWWWVRPRWPQTPTSPPCPPSVTECPR